MLLLSQDATAELRARRQRALSAAQSARIRKGMIRYLVLVRAAGGGERGVQQASTPLDRDVCAGLQLLSRKRVVMCL